MRTLVTPKRSLLWLTTVAGAVSVSACRHDQIRSSTAGAAATAGSSRERGTECPSIGAERAPLGDAAITAAVQEQLRRDPGVDARKISVATTDGIVHLTGSVSDLLSKERAAIRVETLRGVRAVSDRLEVAIAQRDDREIERDVRNALLLNAATDAYEVHAASRDGVVTLSGKVQSWQERRLAERMAKSVRGVRRTVDKIAIDYGAQRTDTEIGTDIESRLRWDALVDSERLRVSVEAGDVRLAGHVGSVAERSRAYADAWVNGVESVDISGVQVDAWARRPELATNHYPYGHRTDAEVVRAIKDAAHYDPRVQSSDIQAQVEAGYVTLRGTVDSLEARHALESLARHTVGVYRVRNFVQVTPDELVADEVAERRVEAALQIDPLTAPAEISADVVNGKVILAGTADNRFVAAEAVNAAARIPGVTDVESRMRVKYPTRYAYSAYLEPYSPSFESWAYLSRPGDTRSDEELACEIERELAQSSANEPTDVSVSVIDGKATLTGTVDTWRERSAAAEDALAAGASAVHNQLQVE